MKKYLQILQACPLFHNKDRQEITSIIEQSKHKICAYKKNEYICQCWQSFPYLGIVLEGSLEVHNNLESGKIVHVLYKNKGNVLGGAMVFSKDYDGQFDVIAKETCKLLLIEKKSVFNVLLKDSVIASNILDLFSREIINLNKKIVLFSYSLIREKIAYFLLQNIESNAASVIHLPYSKKALSEHLHVSRSTLSRELKKLSTQGILEINHKTIVILNKQKLEAILNNNE
ncbi:Crp/Fnr family transcriptional regulator [Vallitalea pronyensis]|uniref:Crp/Fnr family transcriptional regulator n=1 Tax=Vallitalea pronyensis TaxID=1348613 RepID=A0A8J8MIX1_9FIRM|nr:Crp/Fnr family transcriptional regulator [Vallitalea pronyensis]QUI22088.1 Crp/Fnr family transcriptional regulator [Vallitalea pronyensis]